MYTDRGYAIQDVGTVAAVDLTSAATQTFSKIFGDRFRAQRLMVEVTTATVSTGNIVVTFFARPTFGSDVGRVSLGTVLIPTGATVGQVYYKDVAEGDLSSGYQLVYVVSTAAAGPGAAGQGIPMVQFDYHPDVPKNQSLMVASA